MQGVHVYGKVFASSEYGRQVQRMSWDSQLRHLHISRIQLLRNGKSAALLRHNNTCKNINAYIEKVSARALARFVPLDTQ